ncbi:3322_t:CDS:2, partial [Acaulospora colombiana]
YMFAYEDAEEALTLDPVNIAAYYLTVESLIRRCDYKTAWEQLEEALKIEPANSDLLRKRDELHSIESTQRTMQNSDKKPDEPYIIEAHINRHQKKYDKSINLYTKAAETGNAEALYNLALLYRQGHGCKIDFNKALEYLNKAVSQPLFIDGKTPCPGVALAHNSLANHYRNGLGIKQDLNKAFKHYKLSIDGGEPAGMNNLAAAELYTRAADKNFPMAQYELGVIYSNNYSPHVEKNIQLAKRWFRKAAENDFPDAMVELLKLEYSSIEELIVAAETGGVRETFILGVALEKGINVIEPDIEFALKLFEDAAKRGFNAAQLRLGDLYLNSLTNSRDEEQIHKGIKYISEAAQSEYPPAQFRLSEFYQFGEYGFKKNIDKALSWRIRAIENGFYLDDSDFNETNIDFEKNAKVIREWEISQNINDTEFIGRKDRFNRYALSKLEEKASIRGADHAKDAVAAGKKFFSLIDK